MASIPGPMNISVPTPQVARYRDATVDTSALSQGADAIERGLGNFAGDVTQMAAYQKQQDDTVDIARAEAEKTTGLMGLTDAFKTDPNYDTFQTRATEGAQSIVSGAGDLIRDPTTRLRWLEQSKVDAARTVGAISDQADSLRTGAEKSAYLTSMDQFQKIATDPGQDPGARQNAMISMATMVHAGLGNRMLTPEEGYQWSKAYLQGSEEQLAQNQAMVDIDNNPAAVVHNMGVPTTPTGSELTDAQMATAGGSVPLDVSLARMTAEKLGDQNFPKDNASAAAYLTDPKINAKYVAQATSDMSQRYNGDTTAAVIATAPGGGTKLADLWVHSNHSESVLPPAVDKYYRATMAAFAPQTGTVQLPIEAKGVDLSTIDTPVLDRFEKLQSAFGKTLTVVQGPVPTNPDAAIGGTAPSTPVLSRGLDVDVSGLSDADRTRLVATASAMGFGGVGIYDNEMRLDAGPPRAWGKDGTPDTVPAAMQPVVDQHINGQGVTDIPPNPQPVAPQYAAMPFDKRIEMYNRARQALDQQNTTGRTAIELATQNAPAALSMSGTYTGYSPTANDFVKAYGGVEGIARWNGYSTSLDTAKTTFGMKTMPADEITAAVANSRPTDTGDLAADQMKQFTTVSTAAQQVLKAREDDPAAAVMQAFPDVAKAWQGVGDDPATVSNAIAMTATAETKLGITNQQLLPKDFAHNVAATFANQQLPADNRVGAITSTVMLAKTPDQQRAVFQQLVKEGVPQYAQGAMYALERGDMESARTLFKATMVDPSKLPGKMPQGQGEDDIRTEVQSQLFSPGGLATVTYGLTNGTAKNYDRAAQDGTLLTRAATLHLIDGSAGGNVNTAVQMAAKEVFGDRKVMANKGQGAGVNVSIPTAEDQGQLQRGFTALLPRVEEFLNKQTDPFLAGVNKANSQYAVLAGIRDNMVRSAINNGYWANGSDDNSKFTFVEPKTGMEIPIPVSLDDVKAAAASTGFKPGMPDPRLGITARGM